MKAKFPFSLPLAIFTTSALLAVAQDDPSLVLVAPDDTFPGIVVPGIPDLPPVTQNLDYGDAPEDNPQYPTLQSSNGARHLVIPSPDGFLLTLGTKVDTELDGQPSAGALGDDAQGPLDDEDGVVFLNSLAPGAMAKIEVWSSGEGQLDAWVDFNRDGIWSPGEKIFDGEGLVTNLNVLGFTVPPSAMVGDTYARFRISSGGVVEPTGLAPDGEVEDYLVAIGENGGGNPDPLKDWGDAPEGIALQNGTASYPVTDGNGGAYHLLTNSLYLGTSVDPESNGSPSSLALRDDVNAPVDDEDGITFTSAIFQGGLATLEAVASASGRIDAWVDFNQDGDWLDIGEQIFASHSVVAGVNSLSFLVPATAATGGTYARFRISSSGGLDPGDGAPDGEVEDYHFGLEGGGQPSGEFDWGDAPNSPALQIEYPTLDNDSGAYHLIANGIYLGAMCDPESDGQPHSLALGDDNDGFDDEDGVFFSSANPSGIPVMEQGSSEQIAVVASAPGYINAFLDFNRDGDWADQGEHIVVDGVAVAGANVYSFPVPSSAQEAWTYLRVRINSAGGLGSTGGAADGEVEDYVVEIQKNSNPVQIDWGDAPDQIADATDYPTMDLSSGASHQIDDLFLGEWIDPEPDGQSSAMALGDDLDGNDDDDGVRFLTPMVSGSYALVQVYPTMTGILDAWIDWNGDKDWTDVGEQVFNSVTVNPGQVLVFKVPTIEKPLKTFARFRLSHGGSSYDGHQIGGEVEDYRVKVGKKSGWVLEPKLPNMLALNWDAELGMNYFIQNSATPQEWIRENLGEHEVPRVDELFPTGVAWDSLPVMNFGADGGPSQVRPWWEGSREPVRMSREFGVDRSKTMSLFRVIAMPK
ncbi:MAG: hypothetical protein CMN04_07330 [Roseibacillus sp.]|nr:hypothetical protein [Roseibacillus sp.]|tara:strand:+ start:8871 stop:11462 length:2592 start_codon:yes stop_codon:yes gene_type:complete